jgi:hypothetical protein
MPRKEIDYSKIVIYKIVCNDLSITDLYVGSTTDFRKRKNGHKSHCCNENDSHYNLKVYKMIRENGGWDNWTMLEIEKYPCSDGNESRLRERYHLELLDAKLNSMIPSRTNEEQKKYNKEYNKEYFQQNKDKLKENKKEYNINNKDKIYQKKKEWEKLNKDKINERRREMYKLKKELSV